MSESPPKLTALQMFCCILMCCNPELLAKSPIHDRMTVVRHAALLTLVSFASGIAWVAFASQFMPLATAIPCGIFAACFVFLIDLSIGTAEWALAGILRRPGTKTDGKKKFGLFARFAMTAILSVATSTGAAQAMFQKAIERQRLAEQREINIQIDNQAAARIRTIRDQRLGSRQHDVDEQVNIIHSTTPALDKAREEQAEAAARATAAEQEADKELHGGNGYSRGAGPKWRAANAAKVAAENDLARVNANLASFQPRLDAAQQDLEQAQERLRAGESEIQSDVAKIEAARDANHVKDESDPLINTVALDKVFADPVTGWAARKYSWMMMGVLMTIELAYILVKLLFEPASIYTLLLIKSTRVRAEEEMVDYERQTHEIQATRVAGPRLDLPPLRIIDSDFSPRMGR